MTCIASASRGPIAAGTPGLSIPAFSPAIRASVSPRNCIWSYEIGVIAVTSGRSITLVASSRPPSPVSSRSRSAGAAPAAEPGLEQKQIGGLAREGQKSGGCGDLEKCDRVTVIGDFALLEQVD